MTAERPIPDAEPEGVPRQATRLLERIAADYAVGGASGVAARAKEEFLAWTGRVHEDDAAFDARMAQFLEWFVIDRPADGAFGPTPAERFGAEHGEALPPADRELLLGLCCSRRSLFDPVGRDRAGRILADDLLHGVRWAVASGGNPIMLASGELCDGRLVGVGGEVHFTEAFCYHPSDASARLRRYAERHRARGTPDGEVLAALMRMRLAFDRSMGAPLEISYPLDA